MFSKLRLETCTCVLQAAFVYRAVCFGVARMKVMSMTRSVPCHRNTRPKPADLIQPAILPEIQSVDLL